MSDPEKSSSLSRLIGVEGAGVERLDDRKLVSPSAFRLRAIKGSGRGLFTNFPVRRRATSSGWHAGDESRDYNKIVFDEKPLAMGCGFNNMSQLPGTSSINYKPLSRLQVRALAAFSNGKRRHGCSRMLASSPRGTRPCNLNLPRYDNLMAR